MWSGIFFSLLVFGALSFFYLKEDRPEAPVSLSPQWELAIDKVVTTWEHGPDLSDSLLQKNCPLFSKKNKENISSDLRSCSYQLFSCYFQNREEKIKYKNEWSSFQVKLSDENIQRSDIRVKLLMEKKELELTLKNICQRVELPQAYYLGRFFKNTNKLKERLWHTSDIEYQVDKYLVRNNEILYWAKEKEKNELVAKFEDRDPFDIASDLTAMEMESFCHDHKSEVLSAKIHDALTYHHGRQSIKDLKDTPPSVNSAPHPFGPRKDDGPQFKDKFDEESCHKVYSKECLDKKIDRSFPEGMGWSGVAELLGGPMEYVANSYLPRKNLVASSYYFNFDSPWHQAGQFAYWDGKKFGKMNFNFFGQFPQIDRAKKVEFKVGFRCMKKHFIGSSHE